MKDKLGTWWDENTEIHLGLYKDLPLFYWHLLEGAPGTTRAFKPERAGSWILSSFEPTADGWLARADVDDNPSGDLIWALVEQNNAATSSGALPQRVRVRKQDGYVQEWALIEGSVATRDGVASMPGTTTARHVRAALAGLESDAALSDDVQLVRSIWVMNANLGSNGATAAPAAPAAPAGLPPVPTSLPSVHTLTEEQINSLVDKAVQRANADAATRALPPGQALPATPTIQVFSKFDHLSLLAQCMVFQARKTANPVWRPDDEFIRSLGMKVERQYRQENDHVASLGSSAFRAIDPLSHQTWSKYMGPAFRANELMTSTGSGYGDELVPTLMSSVLWYAVRLESRVMGLLESFEMPSNPYTAPVMSGGPTIRKVAEPTGQSQATIAASVFPASKPTTALITWSAGMIGALALASQILFEDAGLDVAEALATQLSMNMGQAADNVLINGDEDSGNTNISHHGAGIAATAYDAFSILDGLRDQAFANSDTYDAGTLGIDDLTEVQKKMGARGILGLDLKNLVIVCDPGLYYKLKTLAEYRTYDKAGDAATILTGQVGFWDAIPVIVSDEMEYTDGTQVGKMVSTHDGTEGNFLVVNRRIPKLGMMRQVQVESEKVKHTDLYAISASMRMDLQFLQAGGVGYGIGVTV